MDDVAVGRLEGIDRGSHGTLVGVVRARPMVAASIGAAWLIILAAQATGNAGLLHHHALIEGGIPLWAATALFLVSWQVMVAAMMLPASLPAIGHFMGRPPRVPAIGPFVGRAARMPATDPHTNRAARMPGNPLPKLPSYRAAQPRRALAAFLGSYALAWSVFGLCCFLGDAVLHRIVDATPWLVAHAWLIEAGVVAVAGVYQFVPQKQRSLAACRHPAAALHPAERGEISAFRIGLDHGLDCLGSSWALMLLMFAEGFASVWWMAGLTAVMVYEATGRHGQRAVSVVGLLLLAGAAAIVANGVATV